MDALQAAQDVVNAAPPDSGVVAESPFRHIILRKRKRKELQSAVSALKVWSLVGICRS